MELENIISQVVNNSFGTTVFISGSGHFIKAPTVRKYADMLEIMEISLLDSFEKQVGDTTKDISLVKKVVSLFLNVSKASDEDVLVAFREIISLTLADEYFKRVPKSISKPSKGKSKGGKTLLGQVTSFMEDFGMTFDEVVNSQYPLLLMLQHDKPRPDYDKTEEVVEISGREMLKKKR